MAALTLPATLIAAIQEQRAILFLGSGASRGAVHPKGEQIPLGGKLRDILCEKYFRGEFTPGDSNFEGQFWYARELFLGNRVSDAHTAFENLNGRAPGRFRGDAAAEVVDRNGRFVTYQGTVARKEEGYGFVRPLDFAVDLFASRGESARHEWNQIAMGGRVSFYLAFNRRGPRAIKLTPRRA
jgi:cold shock CspA family protein